MVFAGERSPCVAESARRRAGTHLRVPPEPTKLDEQSREFFAWLCSAGGVDAESYRTGVLLRRRGACLRAARARSLHEAREGLSRDPLALGRTLGALLIGVTSFFRDRPVFEALEAELAHTRIRARFRVVSVGCSDGAELYSVAMLLADLGVLDSCDLLGVDCRQSAIAAAARGAYAPAAVEGMDPGRRERYLRPHPHGVAVADTLRAACRWGVADAFTAPEIAGADLILCRNLAIYLNPEPADRLWTRLASALRPGGLLVTGKAERPTAALRDGEGRRAVRFDGTGGAALRRIGPCLYRKECQP